MYMYVMYVQLTNNSIMIRTIKWEFKPSRIERCFQNSNVGRSILLKFKLTICFPTDIFLNILKFLRRNFSFSKRIFQDSKVPFPFIPFSSPSFFLSRRVIFVHSIEHCTWEMITYSPYRVL